ncbi:integrase [Orientia tsutsugamushi]|nr:integrase [Orientia tsutsugamushi]
MKSTEVYARTSVNTVTVYTNRVVNKTLTIDDSNVYPNKIISKILVSLGCEEERLRIK